ncbi:hypothetical protein G5S30_24820 [Escherichia coli]|nr:hypothetical protein [Escherichia coli]
MNKSLTVLPSGEYPTMSSLEMVDYINADRKSKAEAEGLAFPCKKYRKLEHRSFMKKVPRVLGMQLQNFLQLIPISTEQVVLWRGIFAIFPSVKLASWQ